MVGGGEGVVYPSHPVSDSGVLDEIYLAGLFLVCKTFFFLLELHLF